MKKKLIKLLISEKLLEKHQIKISNETVRQWMIERNYWVTKKRKKNRHPLREKSLFWGVYSN
jgi:hypothetical protein